MFHKEMKHNIKWMTLHRLLHPLSLFKDPGPLAVERQDFERVRKPLRLWVRSSNSDPQLRGQMVSSSHSLVTPCYASSLTMCPSSDSTSESCPKPSVFNDCVHSVSWYLFLKDLCHRNVKDWYKSMIFAANHSYHSIPHENQFDLLSPMMFYEFLWYPFWESCENPVVQTVARSVAWPQWTWESSFLHGLAGLWYRVAMRGRNVIQMSSNPIELQFE